MRKLFLASLLAFVTSLVLTISPLAARTHHQHVANSNSHHALTTKTSQISKARVSRSGSAENKRASNKHAQKHVHAKKRTHARLGSVSLSGVTPVLAAKAREISSSCGSSVISAVSRRGGRSNHPIGRAVDMRGNPSCIYAHLKGWPGGYSTDYRSAGHVHISYNPGGQEWGLRFAHGGHGATRIATARAATRLAGLRNVYASAHHVSSVRRTARRGIARPVAGSQTYESGLHGAQ